MTYLLFFSLTPTPPRSTLFPYTTLFRSGGFFARLDIPDADEVAAVGNGEGPPIAGKGYRAIAVGGADRKSTRLNSSHRCISYAVFCLKKKTERTTCPAS